MTALLLIPLMLMAALAVDVGGWYAQTSRMQRAADAAALAGVVWMPDFAEARSVALATAAQNGFEHGVGGVVVDVTSPGDEQLSVTISAPGTLYLGQLIADSVAFDRHATAEYVLPVPLGSPRNYFGTGTLASGNVGGIPARENLWLSINPWCTDKVDGDRYQSRFDGNRPYSNSSCPSDPDTSPLANTEYRATGYELYIDLPASRPSATQIRLFDARYSPGGGSPDNQLHPGSQDYTFTVFAADDTPLDDSDNPPMPGCSQTFTASTNFQGFTYLGSNRWNIVCTIDNGDPAGRYILRMHNQPGARPAAGANNFSVVAVYASQANNSTSGLCDARSASNCPRVHGKDAISVYASEAGSSANFFLSEIGPQHAGKQLRITLFDPGEGGNNIRIRRPTGANTWVFENFSYSSSNGYSGTNVSSLDVTGARFNGETVTLVLSLPSSYNPPASNRWWQIQYNFTAGAQVTDRTTWSAQIVGDPVHLVE